MNPPLPPTSLDLLEPTTRPYFLWWTDATVRTLHERHLGRSRNMWAYLLGLDPPVWPPSAASTRA